jgi:UDP-N-acetylmuramate dehydrogenase
MTLPYRTQVPLKPFNTFSLPASAEMYARASSDAEVAEALAFAEQKGMPVTLLGGGSNLLLTQDVEGLVVQVSTRGVNIIENRFDGAIVEAAAGEPWHPFVRHTLDLGLFGLENLSLIPGTVGAAPVQNIGAYGIELKDSFHSLMALDRRTGDMVEMSADDCEFGYRESRLKAELDRWAILRVRFKLNRQADLRLDYGPIRQRLASWKIEDPSPLDVSRAICEIRSEKLPDPLVLPNAGSFFKNPIVPETQAQQLRFEYPDMVMYPQADGTVKLAAGWLIDSLGWRGYRLGDVGVHENQALVLVNHGDANGMDVMMLAGRIKASVSACYGVELEIEPRVI